MIARHVEHTIRKRISSGRTGDRGCNSRIHLVLRRRSVVIFPERSIKGRRNTTLSLLSLTVRTTGLVDKPSKGIARGENARLAPGALVSGFARRGDDTLGGTCALVKNYHGGFSVCGEPDDDHGGRMLHIWCQGQSSCLDTPMTKGNTSSAKKD